MNYPVEIRYNKFVCVFFALTLLALGALCLSVISFLWINPDAFSDAEAGELFAMIFTMFLVPLLGIFLLWSGFGYLKCIFSSSPAISIQKEGFAYQSFYSRKKIYAWSDIDRIHLSGHGKYLQVGFLLRTLSDQTQIYQEKPLRQKLKKLYRNWYGFDFAIHPMGMSTNAQKLTDLFLEAFKTSKA